MTYKIIIVLVVYLMSFSSVNANGSGTCPISVPINGHGAQTNRNFTMPAGKFILAPFDLSKPYILTMSGNRGIEDILVENKQYPKITVTNIYKFIHNGVQQEERQARGGSWKLYKAGSVVPDIDIAPWSSNEFATWSKHNPALAQQILLENSNNVPDFALITDRGKKKYKIFKPTTLAKIIMNTDQEWLIPATCNANPYPESVVILKDGRQTPANLNVEVNIDVNEGGEVVADDEFKKILDQVKNQPQETIKYISNKIPSAVAVEHRIDGNTNNYIVLFDSQESGTKMSGWLRQRYDIKGGSGNEKYVAQHLRNNPHFGIILTDLDVRKLSR